MAILACQTLRVRDKTGLRVLGADGVPCPRRRTASRRGSSHPIQPSATRASAVSASSIVPPGRAPADGLAVDGLAVDRPLLGAVESLPRNDRAARNHADETLRR